jgi:hypothetical protein
MKFLQCLGFLLFFSFNCLAQKNFFLYIQTENKQPFSARMDGRIYSSTEMGYLIIPKLFAGEFPITIDFPKSIITSQQFDISINHQDLGFILKNIESNGWVLQNLQTSALISAKNNNTTQQLPAKNDSDDFTKTLSQITNTPLSDEKKNSTEKTTLQPTTEPVDSVQASTVNDVKKERSDISLIFSTTDSSGQSLIYSVSQLDATDTVVVFIPAENEPLKAIPIKDTVKETIDVQVSTESNVVDTPAVNTEIITNAAKCDKIAGEKDFLQLRKKMASQDKEKDMLSQAEKAFQSKCFSTQQVRNLSGLFLEEDMKMGFLIMSRTKLTDPENFGSLISLLSEEASIIKFKELIQ